MENDADRKQDTAKAILKMYVNFINYFEINKNDIFINEVTVLDASMRYWKDVDTMRKIHSIEYPDCYKVAGYTTYWLTKLKPITIVNAKLYSDKRNEFLININEYFSLYVAIGFINSHNGLANPSKNFYPTQPFVKNLIYTLRYRITTGDNLSLMYQSLEATNIS